jgi:hypothetical protein
MLVRTCKSEHKFLIEISIRRRKGGEWKGSSDVEKDPRAAKPDYPPFGLGGFLDFKSSRSIHVIMSIAVFKIRLAGRLPKTTSTIAMTLYPPHLRIVKSFTHL